MLAILLAAIILLAQPFGAYSLELNHDYPRLANYYLRWDLTEEQAIELAKWDVVIIDMEAQVNSPNQLRRLRQLNPKIVILAYITSQEIRSDASSLASNSLRRKLAGQIPDSWYLKNGSGQKLTWWPGTYLLNISEQAPANASGQQWNDFLPEFVAKEIFSTGLWDGVFYDNMWGGVTWLNQPIDFNNDGIAEARADQGTAGGCGRSAIAEYRRKQHDHQCRPHGVHRKIRHLPSLETCEWTALQQKARIEPCRPSQID